MKDKGKRSVIGNDSGVHGKFRRKIRRTIDSTTNSEKGKKVVMDGQDSGYRKVMSSFVSATTEYKSFGTIRVPRSFHLEFGQKFQKEIKLTCKDGYVWEAEYDQSNRKIIGLDDFMKQHKVKQWSLLIFDYLGNSKFNVIIYKCCGVEADYGELEARKCKSSGGPPNFKESEYIVGIDELEREKSLALIHFNGYQDRSDYYKRSIYDFELFKHRDFLVLRDDMYNMYKHWGDGDTVNFMFCKRKWEIEIKEIGKYCMFGPSWVKFCQEAGLEVGDLLIFRTILRKNYVSICTFKKEDLLDAEKSAENAKWSFSFFQFVHSDALQHGEIVPPFLVDKFHSEQLYNLRKVRCGGEEFSVSYYNGSKVIVGFGEIFSRFNVVERDTMFFTMLKKGEACLRIYRESGMELDYELKCLDTINLSDHWYLNEVWNEEALIDARDIADEAISDANKVAVKEYLYEEFEFSSIMLPSNVTFTSHGVYIPKELEARMTHWNKDTNVVFRKKDDIWNIGFNETNGRKRFCAGWNSFVRSNQLKKGDKVVFNLQNDGNTFDIRIIKKKK